MKCPNCKRDNEPGKTHCIHCGASLSSADETEPPAPEPAVPTDAEKQDTSEPTREDVVAKWQIQYEQDAREGKKKKPGFWWDDFRNVFLVTAIPIVVLAVISAAGMALGQPSLFESTLLDSAFSFVWLAAGALCIAAFITGVIFAVLHKGEIAAGMFAGVGIGIIALGLTCFTNVVFGH